MKHKKREVTKKDVADAALIAQLIGGADAANTCSIKVLPRVTQHPALERHAGVKLKRLGTYLLGLLGRALAPSSPRHAARKSWGA